jgi:hypothetical protein
MERTMSEEDESKFNEIEFNHVGDRSAGESLQLADIESSDSALAPRPMQIAGIGDRTIYNLDQSFLFYLEVAGRHGVWFKLFIQGVLFWEVEDEKYEGLKWHSRRLTTSGISGKCELKHYWMHGNQGSGWYVVEVWLSDLPQIDDVAAFTNVITGAGGDATTLRICTVDGSPISGDFQSSNGRWSTTLNGNSNTYEIYVEQSALNYDSRTSAVKKIVYLKAPRFLTPLENAHLVAAENIVITGNNGSVGQIIQVFNEGGVKELGRGVVDVGGVWTIPINLSDRVGEVTIAARHLLSGNEAWSSRGYIVVPQAPNIGVPGQGATSDVRGVISGGNGTVGAMVEVFKDLDLTVKIGQGTVKAGGLWSVETYNLDMTPGAFAIVARQTYAGIPSGLSAPRAFNVRPPRVEQLRAVATNNGTVTITGTGYIGAELDIWITGGSVIKTFTVAATSWTKSYPDWLPGAYSIDARQKVRGLNNAWIDSEWNTQPATFTVKVPPPTLTHSAGADQKPAFSGSGNVWDGHAPARVELQITGSSNPLPTMPIVNVVNDRWANTATAQWEPGTYSVKARQLFKPNGKPDLQSDWTSAAQVVIKAPLPSIDTITDNGLSPDFAGTCWKGAVVNLTFSGSATVYPVPDADKDGRWTYRRPAPFAPGSYTVKATQTFGGQTSNEFTKNFSVAVPRPVIKSMAPPVGHEPIIEGGGGYAGAEMTIYDYLTGQPLHQMPVTEDAWKVPLALKFSDYQIYAIQSFNGLSSEHSELISFKAELLPPIVNTPQPVDTVARSFRIEGLACKKIGIEVASVEVWLEGGTEPWARIPVNYAGVFWFNATLPLGTRTLKFKQRITGVESAFGNDLVLVVVPAKPVIETPAEGEAIESRLAVSGFGYVGDTVSVAFADALDVILGTTQVEQNGTWSLWLLLDRPAGHPSLVVQQSFENHLSGWTAPRPVELRTQPPQFTTPLPGRWVEPKPTFAGTSWAGAKIELRDWSNPDISLTISHAVDDAWEATPTNDLRPNEHWVCATQSAQQSGGVTQVSASADSPRFEVMAVNDDPDSIP